MTGKRCKIIKNYRKSSGNSQPLKGNARGRPRNPAGARGSAGRGGPEAQRLKPGATSRLAASIVAPATQLIALDDFSVNYRLPSHWRVPNCAVWCEPAVNPAGPLDDSAMMCGTICDRVFSQRPSAAGVLPGLSLLAPLFQEGAP